MRCVFEGCGKRAVVVFQGFSFCEEHYEANLEGYKRDKEETEKALEELTKRYKGFKWWNPFKW